MRIGESIRLTRGYDPFENQVKRAENAINHLQEIELKEWFIELLNILKNNQCARVVGNNSKQLDVTKIAHTYTLHLFLTYLTINICLISTLNQYLLTKNLIKQ